MENQLDNQGGDSYYSDAKAAEIAANFSYDGYQVVRREMFAHLTCPAVTIRKESITFNTSCINGLEDAVYIQVLISRNQKRMVIKKCDENDKDALRWCISRSDKRKSRRIVSRDFSRMVYQMMEWDDTCRYKMAGHKIEFQGQTLYVFELSEPEIYKERRRRSKDEKEQLEKTMSPEELAELKKKEMNDARTPFYPEDVQNTFGVPVEEHEDKPVLGNLVEYTDMSKFSTAGGQSEEGPSAEGVLSLDTATSTEEYSTPEFSVAGGREDGQ